MRSKSAIAAADTSPINMLLSKANKKRVISASKPDKVKQRVPSVEELIAARDYQGAITVLRFKRQGNRGDVKWAEWLAYAYFHHGEHDKALAIYQELLHQEDPDPMYHTYCAACHYYMGLTSEAEEAVQKGPRCPLATRILFHCARSRGDDDALMAHHSSLTNSLEDQLSLAALHYNRGHYQEATDIYKALLLEHRDLLALNVYVALCYAKLDYYDVNSEILQVYLSSFPTSPAGINLKACNTFRLQDGKAAEADLKGLADVTAGKHTEHDLIRHNLVVFKGGEGAQQVLPALGDTPSEAQLNLVISALRAGRIDEASALMQDIDPTTPHEYILKAVVLLCLGQASGSQDQLKAAQQYFQVVGSSPSECDTIPGRQAMASCFFLLKQFEDVLVFLNSIRSYFASDDAFNWNYGLALAATGKYKEAEEALASVQQQSCRADPVYLQWRARCLVLSGQPRAAWELYAAAQAAGHAAAVGEAGYALLQLIADDCYRMGSFYYAAKAFDILERLDPSPEMFEAKRGAAVGAFQMVVAGKEQPEVLGDVLEMLRRSANLHGGVGSSSTALQVEQICRVIRQWGDCSGLL